MWILAPEDAINGSEVLDVENPPRLIEEIPCSSENQVCDEILDDWARSQGVECEKPDKKGIFEDIGVDCKKKVSNVDETPVVNESPENVDFGPKNPITPAKNQILKEKKKKSPTLKVAPGKKFTVMSKGKVCDLTKKKPARKPKFKKNVAIEATPQNPIMRKWLNSTPARKNAPEDPQTVENATETPKTPKCASPAPPNVLSSTPCVDAESFKCDVSSVIEDKSTSSMPEFLSLSSPMANAIDTAFREIPCENSFVGEDPNILENIEATAADLCINAEVSTARSLEEALDIEVFDNSTLAENKMRLMDTILGEGSFSNLWRKLKNKELITGKKRKGELLLSNKMKRIKLDLVTPLELALTNLCVGAKCKTDLIDDLDLSVLTIKSDDAPDKPAPASGTDTHREPWCTGPCESLVYASLSCDVACDDQQSSREKPTPNHSSSHIPIPKQENSQPLTLTPTTDAPSASQPPPQENLDSHTPIPNQDDSQPHTPTTDAPAAVQTHPDSLTPTPPPIFDAQANSADYRSDSLFTVTLLARPIAVPDSPTDAVQADCSPDDSMPASDSHLLDSCRRDTSNV